jgi:CubicO group peptidase (beta-lactamase class C family)
VSPAASQALSEASTAPKLTPDLIGKMTARFERFAEAAHVPGLAWGIVLDGRLVHVGTFGVENLDTREPVTADTQFRIASMSKAFTALAILELRNEGKLSLDDPIERFVPEAKGWKYPTSDSPRLRIGDLIGHTTGFGPDDPWSDRQQAMSEADFTALLQNGLSFNHAPQAQYEYSSLGYALLGRVVTNASGERYDRYIRSEFMHPLGMDASGYEIADVPSDRLAVGYRWDNDAFAREPSMANGAFGAMGGVHTSANDYARWVTFLLSAWPVRDGPEKGPVDRAAVRQLAVGTSFPRLGSRPRPGDAGPCPYATVYGAGINVVRDCDLGMVLTHNGGYPGYGSTMMLMPEYGVGIFAFDNRTYGAPVGAVFDVAQMLKDAGMLRHRQLEVSEALAKAYKYAGEMYRAGEVEATKNQLSMNFLMDQSAENWAREFARLKGDVGHCDAQEAIIATGRLSGDFIWHCDRGSIEGTIALSPTAPPLIETLSLQSRAGK